MRVSASLAYVPTRSSPVGSNSPGKIDPSKPLKPEEQRYVEKFRRYQRRKSRDATPPTRERDEEFDLYTSGPDSPSRKGKELKEM